MSAMPRGFQGQVGVLGRALIGEAGGCQERVIECIDQQGGPRNLRHKSRRARFSPILFNALKAVKRGGVAPVELIEGADLAQPADVEAGGKSLCFFDDAGAQRPEQVLHVDLIAGAGELERRTLQVDRN